jgi:hypothetical protein
MKVLRALPAFFKSGLRLGAFEAACVRVRQSGRFSQQTMRAKSYSSRASQPTAVPPPHHGDCAIPWSLDQRPRQLVVGASHRRAAPRSQSVACLVAPHWSPLTLAALAIPRLPKSAAFRRPRFVVFRPESRFMYRAQPNPSLKRTCLRQAA